MVRSRTRCCWKRSQGSSARLMVGRTAINISVGLASRGKEIVNECSMAGFELQLPGIRGKQAGQVYYLVMCPLRHIPRLFQYADEAIPPELRAQRVLNQGRVPEIARYITENCDSYVLSSIAASIDTDAVFEPAPGKVGSAGLGMLRLPISTRLLIHDGLHRRAAIESALRF